MERVKIRNLEDSAEYTPYPESTPQSRAMYIRIYVGRKLAAPTGALPLKIGRLRARSIYLQGPILLRTRGHARNIGAQYVDVASMPFDFLPGRLALPLRCLRLPLPQMERQIGTQEAQ